MQKQHLGQIGQYWLSKRSGSDAWCRTWFDAKTRQTKRASIGTADFQQAQISLAKWVVVNDQPKKVQASDVQLDSVIVRYYENHAKHLRSGEASRYALKKWSDHFGEAMVSEVTLTAQEAFVRKLKDQGCSDGYIGRILNVGKAALNRAYKNGEIESIPFVMTGSKGRERQRLLSLDETAALFDAAREEHTLVYLMLAFNTLARPEAILELKRFQIDFDNRLIHLNPPGRIQNKKRRPTVPISNSLMPWLQGIQNESIVSWRGKPIKSIKKAFRRTRERAGLDNRVVPYTIRHTMATELRKRGVPAWDVAGMLGHKTEGITERYAKYAPDYRDLAIRAIDEYFKEIQPLTNKRLVFGAGKRVSCVLAG
jgi:integrase